MSYEALKCFNLDDEFQGWIVIGHTPKGDLRIEGNWVYSKDDLFELNKKLEFLNEANAIKQHWPDPKDPEVKALLADETFEPAEMEYVEVIDEAKSNLEFDDGQILEDVSHIVYKTVLASSPSAEFERINKACEVIARKRAGLTSAK